MPRASLVLAITTAQKIFAISSSRDKNSCRSFARLSAWCLACFARKRINEYFFRVYLLTECAYSKTEHEPQGGDQSLKRHCGQGNRPVSFRGVKRRGNPLNRNATQWRLPLTALVLAITTAQKIFAIKIRRIRNRTAVSQDCLLVGRTSCANGTALRQHIYANNWRIGNGIAYKYAMPRAMLDYFATTAQIAHTALRLWQPPQMSFRGVK